MKSTVDEIRQRFDNNDDRFSILETSQSEGIDSLLCLERSTHAVASGDVNRDTVFDHIEKEDSPVPVMTIVKHLRSAEFVGVEVLQKHNCFTAMEEVVTVIGNKGHDRVFK